MTDENKLQDTFAETCDKLNDAYVFCQKELDRLREDNNNLRLDVMYYKRLLKKCRYELEGEFGIGAAKLVDEIDEVLK